MSCALLRPRHQDAAATQTLWITARDRGRHTRVRACLAETHVLLRQDRRWGTRGARGRQSIRQSQEDARRSVRQRPFIHCLSHPRATMSSALSATTSSIPSEEGVGISGTCHQPAGLSRILPASFARLCGHDLTVSAKQGKEKGLLGEPRTPPPPAL